MAKISKAATLLTVLALATVLTAVMSVTGCSVSTPTPASGEEQNQSTYTIYGQKDPRLDAWYLATYVSQDPDEECTSKNAFTGGRRFALGGRTIKVEDGNYTIEFPIKVTGENNDCDYRFRKLELVMKRKHDEELASIHPILSDRQKVSPVYWKTKGGEMHNQHLDTPPSLFTTKKYFRIPEETTFLCKTFWFEEREFRGEHQFHCTMQIDSDVNRTLYEKSPEAYWFSHPEFGVDEMKDETMKIDILVDEKNCKTMKNRKEVQDHFRELEEPSFWQKIF